MGSTVPLLATGTLKTAKDLGLKPISAAQQWPLQQQSLGRFVDVRQMPEVE